MTSIERDEEMKQAECDHADYVAGMTGEVWQVAHHPTDRQFPYWTYNAKTLQEYPLPATHVIIYTTSEASR